MRLNLSFHHYGWVWSKARYTKWYDSYGYPSLAIAQTKTHPYSPNTFLIHEMSSSFDRQQVNEQTFREKAELEGWIKYLQEQPGQLTRKRNRNLRRSSSLNRQEKSSSKQVEEKEDNPFIFLVMHLSREWVEGIQEGVIGERIIF